MNYHLNRSGKEVEILSLEELVRQREAGQLTGTELVWREGLPEWRWLDTVLESDAKQLRRTVPPPVPRSSSSKGPHPVVYVIIAIAAVLFIGQVVWLIVIGVRGFRTARDFPTVTSREENNAGVALASKPIPWKTNTITEAVINKKSKEFVVRQYLEGYEKRGERNPSCDADALQFIRSWIDNNYGGPEATNTPIMYEWGDKLAVESKDPIVLLVSGINCAELREMKVRLEHAVSLFTKSGHRAYPKFYAAVYLASRSGDDPVRVTSLDQLGLQWLSEAFRDNSLQPEDQARIAEILVYGWGSGFFNRNTTAVCGMAADAGKSWQWLSLVLQGEQNVIEAWKARGGGYSDTVTQRGWQGFAAGSARARQCLTQAWKLRPDLPLAPSRMIYVSMGDSDLEEMRTWFDRAAAVQADYPHAWAHLRWGLRPRWYGSHEALLALGATGVHTRRFNSDLPRKYFDVISDVESETSLWLGQHIYGRSDVWPDLKTMYEGYIAEPSEAVHRKRWQSDFAAVAYLAGKYDVARTQLEALDWNPIPASLKGWGADLSLMDLEVAARTGPYSNEVRQAESKRRTGEINEALQLYTTLSVSTNLDRRTAEFVRCRMALIKFEQGLQSGQWMDFLPQDTNDPLWKIVWGEPAWPGDGALEVRSGDLGHMLYCRAPVGPDFEVRGQFEAMRSSTQDFQGGLVMGMPDFDTRINTWEWYTFRMKRTRFDGEIASFAIGWSSEEIQQSLPLNFGTNTFVFRLEHDRATASVNGKQVFRSVGLQRKIRRNQNEFLVGLGAYNDINETVIRYRNLQVRKLPSSKITADDE